MSQLDIDCIVFRYFEALDILPSNEQIHAAESLAARGLLQIAEGTAHG